VVCLDETPNEQVRERCPIRRANPGSTERRKFGYTQNGTANVLTFLMVHTGSMDAAFPDASAGEHLIPALEAFPREHHRHSGVLLVLEGGGSRITGDTAVTFAG
jgi:hypothetical protein